MCCESISVAVVVAFFICWAPFHTQRLISIYSSPDDQQQRATASKALQAVLFYSSGILYYVSSVINPILYNIMSLKFRRAFETTLCRAGCVQCCCRHTADSRVQACTGGRTGRRQRRPMAYRFNGDGHVQMLRIDSNDAVYLRCPSGRRGASAPAKFSNGAVSSGGQARSSGGHPVGHGSTAANVSDWNTTRRGVEGTQRGGQLRAVSCPRYLYRSDYRPSCHGRFTDRRMRVDNEYDQSLVADRTTV